MEETLDAPQTLYLNEYYNAVLSDYAHLAHTWSTRKTMQPKNTICLTFQRGAEEAARFYTSVFPDSHMGNIQYAPGDHPGGKQGNALVVHFTVAGIPCIGLNGGDFPGFVPSMAFSFQIATDTQEETDRYWNAIIDNGGSANACGWCQDKWGIHWQITPRVLTEALSAGGEAAQRAFAAMQTMMKIDVAAIEAAVRGDNTAMQARDTA